MSNITEEMKKRSERHFNSIAPNLLPGVKASDLKELSCSNCQGTIFQPVYSLKFASRFQSKNGMPSMVQFPIGFACCVCDKINPFSPEQLGSDQDGREIKEKTKEENIPASNISISVDDGVKTKEKLS